MFTLEDPLLKRLLKTQEIRAKVSNITICFQELDPSYPILMKIEELSI